MPKTFCVVGHDARQQAAARVLRRAGYGVTAADNAAAADYILLPMSQGRVSDEVARALQGAGQGTWIFAGRPGMPERTAVRQANLPLVDYFLRPELRPRYEAYLEGPSHPVQNFTMKHGIISVGIHRRDFADAVAQQAKKKGIILHDRP